MIFDRKKIIILAVVFAVIFAGLITALILLPNRNQPVSVIDRASGTTGGFLGGFMNRGGSKQSTNPTIAIDLKTYTPGAPTKTPVPATAQEIARENISYLEKSKTETGVYSTSLNCNERRECVYSAQDNVSGIAVIMANANNYLKTKDAKLIDKIRTDLQVYNDQIKVPVIQPGFWHCRMLEATSLGNFPSDIKDLSQKVCARARYLFEVADPVIQKVTANSVGSPNLKSLQTIVGDNPAVAPAANDDGNYLAAYTSEYATIYQMTGSKTNLNLALGFFAEAVKLLPSNDLVFKTILAQASLDLYSATKQADYLNLAKQILDVNKDNLCNKLKTCAIAYFTSSNPGMDQALRKNIEKQLFEKYYDKDGYPGVGYNIGLFKDQTVDGYSFNTLVNGIIIAGQNQ